MERTAGILLPVTSLPSKYGIGCFSKEAYDFIDWLCEANQSCWQILPLGPTGYGDSPYQSFSAFAGNPYLISPELLIEEGVLTRAECDLYDFGNDECRIDYGKLYKSRFKLLKTAFKRSNYSSEREYSDFVDDNSEWLDDYALFMAVKNYHGGRDMQSWEKPVLMRDKDALNRYSDMLSEEIEFQKYMQYKFFSQWSSLKKYAFKRGIQIIGDIPIYTAADSADVWASPELFCLSDRGVPTEVAGCPPDGFSPDGQLWGNPLYRWENHRKDGFKWWIRRLKQCFKLFDVVRIDHFRGFDEYYCVPYGEKTAVNGVWKKGPGIELFNALENSLGKKKIIAEDLGFITDSVRRLVNECGYPGMRILEFAFDSRDSGSQNEHLPHNYPQNCVAYTGTHDNSTLKSWFESISDAEKIQAREYLCDFATPDDGLNLSFISLIMRSAASRCIIPLQDYMNLDDRARINTPSTIGDNWRWRLKKNMPDRTLCKTVGNMTVRYGRN